MPKFPKKVGKSLLFKTSPGSANTHGHEDDRRTRVVTGRSATSGVLISWRKEIKGSPQNPPK